MFDILPVVLRVVVDWSHVDPGTVMLFALDDCDRDVTHLDVTDEYHC